MRSARFPLFAHVASKLRKPIPSIPGRGELAAESLADAIVQWPDWVYRRVDSVHPSEGARGRLKHSMDCIPPPDPRLAYDEVERGHQSINEVEGQLMVPLAFITKGPMRHLDVSRNDGTSMPILGSEEACELMADALILLLTKSGVKRSSELEDAIRSLVFSRGNENLEKAKGLIAKGVWEGQRLWCSQIKIDLYTERFLLNLSTDFVLIGLIPASASGTRQILKFSYHWVLNLPMKDRAQFRDSAKVAFRIAPLEIQLPMHMPAATKSYHLEFHVPPELDIRELVLPQVTDSLGNQVQYPMDNSGAPVAHVHARFQEMPEKDALVKLAVPRRGLWVTALMTSGLTAGIFLLALCLPGAMDTLRQVGGNAAALLLAAPAVFVSFLVISKEHIFSSWMLNPLRVIVAMCALSLFMMAASIAGDLQQPFLMALWVLGAVGSVFSFGGLLFGEKIAGKIKAARFILSRKLKEFKESTVV